MKSDQPGEVLLVVLERGAAWPACVEDCRLRTGTADTVVLAQSEDESPCELAQRACKRLASLLASGRGLQTAAIAAGDATDLDVLASRCAISQAVLRGMRQATDAGKQLWLVAPQRASHGTRHQLMALAGTLTSGHGDPELSISVQFPAGDKPMQPSKTEKLVPLRRRRAVS